MGVCKTDSLIFFFAFFVVDSLFFLRETLRQDLKILGSGATKKSFFPSHLAIQGIRRIAFACIFLSTFHLNLRSPEPEEKSFLLLYKKL